MRQEMVSQKEGEMELTVLTHMDDMKRVALRTQKYVVKKISSYLKKERKKLFPI